MRWRAGGEAAVRRQEVGGRRENSQFSGGGEVALQEELE
jgi:hypothetical protein